MKVKSFKILRTIPILTNKIEPKPDQKNKADATIEDMDIEVENNSFLDFNTTVSKAPASTASKSNDAQPSSKQKQSASVFDEDSYEMMTEINTDCEIILNYEINISPNHPILEMRSSEIEKNASGCLITIIKKVRLS